jgi:AAA ATPase-like protein
VLVGRDAERAGITALLEAARGSSGGVLVIRGVAGSGKSALLAEAAASAADMAVLSTQGVESESPLAFAALQRLLWPLRKGAGGLPAPQRAALQAAFGEVEGGGDRFLAFLGTLSLLADAAEERPVLVIADDAHWLDEASAHALLFVARRLQAEWVALLFAARDDLGSGSGFDAGELPCLTLGGLSGEAAGQLLRGRGPGDVDAAVRDQLVAATAGNPLALGELAEVLSADQLSGRDPLPEQLPLTGGVERAFGDRYRRLPAAAQRFLLVAAADDTARLPVVRDAAGRLDAGDDALDLVEQAGLLRVDGDVLTLYHPLVRSAVYRAATSTQRRAAHGALAGALGGDADLDRLRARVDWNVGSTLVGHRILLQAARDVAPADADRARAMTMVAAPSSPSSARARTTCPGRPRRSATSPRRPAAARAATPGCWPGSCMSGRGSSPRQQRSSARPWRIAIPARTPTCAPTWVSPPFTSATTTWCRLTTRGCSPAPASPVHSR